MSTAEPVEARSVEPASPEPIHAVVDAWHDHLRGRRPGGLESMLHEDCVFWSPVLFKPQRGRELTAMYLAAAAQVFPGEEPGTTPPGERPGGGTGKFRYVKEIREGHHAVLEFETMFGDVAVNGVDIITCDDDGAITEFKVMLRPQKAVQAARERMAAMLESMQG